MNRYDIKTEVLVRSGKDTTSAWTSEAFLNDWINQSMKWASGYKPWPFTEGRLQTTYTATEEWNFEGYKADSFRMILIGGKRLTKLNFEDYLTFKEEEPSGTDYVFSDFGGLVYINANSGLSGTLVAYGQYQPANIPDGDGATADDMETPFSANADEGNQAIIEKTLGYINYRDGKKTEAQNNYLMAQKILDDLWKRIQDEQYKYQTHPDSQGMFKRFNIFRNQKGNFNNNLDVNQF